MATLGPPVLDETGRLVRRWHPVAGDKRPNGLELRKDDDDSWKPSNAIGKPMLDWQIKNWEYRIPVREMLTLKQMREFVNKCSHLHDDTVICVIEENPTPEFDNSGFSVSKLSHERVSGDGDDLGIIYIHTAGLEENIPWKPE